MVKSLYNLIAMDSNSFSERFFFFLILKMRSKKAK